MDISPYWERVIIGAVVIAAVLIDLLREKRKRGCLNMDSRRSRPRR